MMPTRVSRQSAVTVLPTQSLGAEAVVAFSQTSVATPWTRALVPDLQSLSDKRALRLHRPEPWCRIFSRFQSNERCDSMDQSPGAEAVVTFSQTSVATPSTQGPVSSLSCKRSCGRALAPDIDREHPRDRMVGVITIDSNVPNIPRLVSRYLFEPGSAWCVSENNCRRTNADSTYYDTPISMAYLTEYPIPEDYISFVYLDYGRSNASLSRILQNIADRRNVIVLSNANALSTGQYVIRTHNASDEVIAEAIATIINTFKFEGRLLHPDDIMALLCKQELPNKRLEHGMTLDIYKLTQCRRNLRPMINDCVECRQ